MDETSIILLGTIISNLLVAGGLLFAVLEYKAKRPQLAAETTADEVQIMQTAVNEMRAQVAESRTAQAKTEYKLVTFQTERRQREEERIGERVAMQAKIDSLEEQLKREVTAREKLEKQVADQAKQITEQEKQIASQAARIGSLETENTKLKKENEELRGLVNGLSKANGEKKGEKE